MHNSTATNLPPKRALLTINRKSRSGGEDSAQIVSRLRGHGVEVIDANTSDPARLPALIAKYRKQIDCIIVGGGDGSMNAVAPMLVETGLPLGILPMGTANDLARTLEIPTDIERAVEIIAQGVRQRIDLGKVNDRYFFNVANIGLGVRVSTNLSGRDKQRWRILSYVRSLLKTLRSARWFKADIRCDNRRYLLRTIQIAVGNGRYYGGGMAVMDNARIDDGLFSFYSVRPVSIWHLLKIAPLFRSGRLQRAQPVDCDSGTQIELTTAKPMLVTADGDPVTTTPARFVMCAGAVEVFVPIDYLQKKQEENHADDERCATNGVE